MQQQVQTVAPVIGTEIINVSPQLEEKRYLKAVLRQCQRKIWSPISAAYLVGKGISILMAMYAVTPGTTGDFYDCLSTKDRCSLQALIKFAWRSKLLEKDPLSVTGGRFGSQSWRLTYIDDYHQCGELAGRLEMVLSGLDRLTWTPTELKACQLV